jgi:transcriptional regulator with XRE-family HTH domain
MHPQTTGEHLKKRRLELGLKQDQVADKMGVTWNSVSNWERGIYRPSKRALTGIMSFLGYDPRNEKEWNQHMSHVLVYRRVPPSEGDM